jgi:hypothetical protein
MAATTVQLLIELRTTAGPIAGTLRLLPNGHPVQFRGWLQLTETLEAMRTHDHETTTV